MTLNISKKNQKIDFELSIKKEIENLTEELIHLEQLYYSGKAILSDQEYDVKLKRLEHLEKQYPIFSKPNSPTKKVGNSINAKAPKVKHLYPMLSLNNAFNFVELDYFLNTIYKTCNKNIPFFIEPKIDGISISIIYKDNQLFQAITRGDGQEGENVTLSILEIQEIPKKINWNLKNFTLRGEIFVLKSDFKQIQIEAAEKKTNPFRSHRGYVVGNLMLKDHKKVKGEKLKVIFYQLISDEFQDIYEQSKIIDLFRKWKVPTHDEKYTYLSSNTEELKDFINDFGVLSPDIDMPTDGLVIKINNQKLWNEIGYTSKFPKAAIAYKYPSLIKITKLIDIKATVGRTGKITYIGIVEPVCIYGSNIQKATLNNAYYIQKLDLRIGDIVQIFKSGEIIPQIINYIDEENHNTCNKFIPNKYCPSCNSILIAKSEKTEYCLNEDCPDKLLFSLSHFVSRDAMNIEYLSINLIKKFINLGLIKKPENIYYLEKQKDIIINSKINIKEKLFNKIIDNIQKSCINPDQSKVLYSLGINHLGKVISKILLKKKKTILNIFNSTEEDIESIPGVGEKIVKEIFLWYSKEENKTTIKELIALKIIKDQFLDNIVEIEDNPLKNKKIVITGIFAINRLELKDLLEKNYGAFVISSVSKNIDYLIIGDTNISQQKLEKAEKNKIKILNTLDLIKLNIKINVSK